MALPINRLVAAAVALLITAAIGVAITKGVGIRELVVSNSGAAANSYCRRFRADTLVSASAQPRRGYYANPAYGYAVTIPDGLVGYSPARAAARDVVIALPGQPRALLRADAAHDALYDITAAGVHTSDRATVRLFDRLIADEAQPFTLAGVPGGRYRMQMLCRGESSPSVFESIIVVRRQEIYRLDLQTRPNRLRQDEVSLEAMAGSWRWTP